MRQQTRPLKDPAEKVVQDIRRAARKHYSAEEKIRIVLEGLRGEDSIAELCRREGAIVAGSDHFIRRLLHEPDIVGVLPDNGGAGWF